MGKVELKNKIIEIINTSDERFLRMVNALHKTYKEDEFGDDVVAHTMSGEAVTREQYIKNNMEAVASYQKGAFKTQKEILQKYDAK